MPFFFNSLKSRHGIFGVFHPEMIKILGLEKCLLKFLICFVLSMPKFCCQKFDCFRKFAIAIRSSSNFVVFDSRLLRHPEGVGQGLAQIPLEEGPEGAEVQLPGDPQDDRGRRGVLREDQVQQPRDAHRRILVHEEAVRSHLRRKLMKNIEMYRCFLFVSSF